MIDEREPVEGIGPLPYGMRGLLGRTLLLAFVLYCVSHHTAYYESACALAPPGSDRLLACWLAFCAAASTFAVGRGRLLWLTVAAIVPWAAVALMQDTSGTAYGCYPTHLHPSDDLAPAWSTSWISLRLFAFTIAAAMVEAPYAFGEHLRTRRT